jgi:hypothetical protein
MPCAISAANQFGQGYTLAFNGALSQQPSRYEQFQEPMYIRMFREQGPVKPTSLS